MASVTLTRDGAIARVLISNPARRNAMRLHMWTQLADIVDEIADDPAVRVVVLRGDGDEAFVSGADISEFEALRNSEAQVLAYEREGDRARDALLACPVPVVAAIRGVCVGGGLGLAAACDLRYATPGTRFRMPAARLGVGYGYEGTRRFVELIGPARTAELFYTARFFDGAEAERLGFLHRAIDDAAFDEAVETTLASIAGNAPLPIRAAKQAIRASLADPDARDFAAVEAAVRACFGSEDYKEGRRAFMEKRPPRFVGR